jgi:hypothetical protein
MKLRISLLLALAAAPALAETADWGVYQQGSALELAMDRNSIWVEKDGLVHFVNQERFSERQYDKATDIKYYIRRTTGYADCARQQYVFVGFEYASKSGRQLYSTMFPVQRFAWKWQPVEAGSVADTMLQVVCYLAKTAPHKKPE